MGRAPANDLRARDVAWVAGHAQFSFALGFWHSSSYARPQSVGVANRDLRAVPRHQRRPPVKGFPLVGNHHPLGVIVHVLYRARWRSRG